MLSVDDHVKIVREYVGRVTVTDSSLALHLLRTSDVELLDRDIPGTDQTRKVLRARQAERERSASFRDRPTRSWQGLHRDRVPANVQDHPGPLTSPD